MYTERLALITPDYSTQSKAEYERYLQSDIWNNKRLKRLQIDEYTCQMCGTKGTRMNPLQVHHLDYHRKFNEDVEKDLVTLCRDCHQGVHRMMDRVTNSETGQRGWSDSLTIANVTFEENKKRMAELYGR